MKGRGAKILIARAEAGAGTRGSSLGPNAIKVAAVNKGWPLFHNVEGENIVVPPVEDLPDDNSAAKHIDLVLEAHHSICTTTREVATEGFYPLLLLSGDHSNAAAFFSGIRDAFPKQKIGLIWIDAHGDLHSPFSSPTGNLHGMPLSMLLNIEISAHPEQVTPEIDEKWNKLKRMGKRKLSPKLHSEDLFFIGIRDLEEEEWKLIEENNMRYATSTQVQEQGVEVIADRAAEYFKDYDKIYISFDADSLDPSISEGTGTPVPNGLNKQGVIVLLNKLTSMPNFYALEVTEVNPLLDQQNKMAETIVDILQKVPLIDKIAHTTS